MEDMSWEPMEVDLSSQSNNQMDISFKKSLENTSKDDGKDSIICSNLKKDSAIENVSENQVASSMKKYHIHLKRQQNNSLFILKFTIVSACVGIIISLLTYSVNINCLESLELADIRKSLITNLHGQSEAVSEILNALEVSEKRKLIFIYGSTGIGKTYTISLIFENLWRYVNVYHYVMPKFIQNFQQELLLGFSLCKNSVFIIDDIKMDDNIKPIIKHLTDKSETLNSNIIIFLIYNCQAVGVLTTRDCNEPFILRLQERFSDTDIFKKFIPYHRLQVEHLQKCIENELGGRRLKDIEFDNLKKNFNVSQDGCKGVYNKIKALNLL